MLSDDLRQQLLIAVAAATRFAAGILLGTGLAFYRRFMASASGLDPEGEADMNL